jgi:hypothetical protein
MQGDRDLLQGNIPVFTWKEKEMKKIFVTFIFSLFRDT